jgi:hypothetical protein
MQRWRVPPSTIMMQVAARLTRIEKRILKAALEAVGAAGSSGAGTAAAAQKLQHLKLT